MLTVSSKNKVQPVSAVSYRIHC